MKDFDFVEMYASASYLFGFATGTGKQGETAANYASRLCGELKLLIEHQKELK